MMVNEQKNTAGQCGQAAPGILRPGHGGSASAEKKRVNLTCAHPVAGA
jgi:hypothetical protein